MGKLGMHTLKMKILPPDVERTLTVGREAILRVVAYGLAAVCPSVGFSKSRFASFKPQYKQIQTCSIHVTLPGCCRSLICRHIPAFASCARCYQLFSSILHAPTVTVPCGKQPSCSADVPVLPVACLMSRMYARARSEGPKGNEKMRREARMAIQSC